VAGRARRLEPAPGSARAHHHQTHRRCQGVRRPASPPHRRSHPNLARPDPVGPNNVRRDETLRAVSSTGRFSRASVGDSPPSKGCAAPRPPTATPRGLHHPCPERCRATWCRGSRFRFPPSCRRPELGVQPLTPARRSDFPDCGGNTSAQGQASSNYRRHSRAASTANTWGPAVTLRTRPQQMDQSPDHDGDCSALWEAPARGRGRVHANGLWLNFRGRRAFRRTAGPLVSRRSRGSVQQAG
jgi:hypothetical protein